MIDVTTLLEKVSIAQVIEADLGAACKRSGKWLLWSCPFHPDGKTPSLAVTPANGRWHCFGCGKSGDAITWLREREGLTFQEACERLGAGALSPVTPRPVAPRLAQEPPDGPPSATWQEKARQVIAQGEAALWEPAGEKARAWLSGRGLQETTLRRWHIGYNPQDQKIAGLWVERGILIPWEIGGVVWVVNVRRPVTGEADGPKYKAIKGSKPGLYLADTLEAGKPAVLAEGEFDALLLWQEAGDLVGVATLGSASKTLGDLWLPYLLPVPTLLVAYDTDQPGENGAGALTSLTARARRIKPLEGKDITDFWKAGGNLRAWVSFHLTAVADESTPEPCPPTPAPILSLADLRARRADLNARLARDLDVLRAKEDAGDTGEEYQRWLSAWLGLLAEYEGVCEQIAVCRAQPATPAPPPTPAPAPAPPRQLGLFAGAPCTAYAGGR